MIQSVKDIQVYEKSYQIGLEIYKETRAYPREEIFILTSQIRRCATSIPLNLAEGYGKRESTAEFKRYIQMSLGSCEEIKVLLRYSKDLEYLSQDKYEEYTERYTEIGKMLYGLYTNWK